MSVDAILATLRSRDLIGDCRDTIPDMATAFEVQDAVVAELAKGLGGFAGYKIAFNSNALMAKMGLSHPGMGRVFAGQVYDNGIRLDAESYVNLMIEPEIAAVLSADINPGDDLSVQALSQKVERFFPAFEILDRRSIDGLAHVPSIIAHNVFNAGIVVGGPGLPPQEFDFSSLHTNCKDSGETVIEGTGIAPQNPLEALAFLARHFTGRGQVMPAGSLLLLGAHCPLYAVGAGRQMTLDMGRFGSVSFST
ncbi:MAG: hypothetical protein L3J33_08850 [Rhodobacteraceae bacterium]|nr:hypothetical protein [Paracoccaceae bacterium]